MDSLEEPRLISLLRSRLAKPLPGGSAHRRMSPRLESGDRIKFKLKKDAQWGSVMILLYSFNNIPFFPLIQRPAYDGVHGGQISLPGGKQENGDPDLVATAKRETFEEIGIPENDINVIGSLSEFYVGASNHMVLPVVAYLKRAPRFVPDRREVSEVIEAPLEDLVDDSKVSRTTITVAAGYQLSSPYFDLDGRIVWGATAMILSEFKEILKGFKKKW